MASSSAPEKLSKTVKLCVTFASRWPSFSVTFSVYIKAVEDFRAMCDFCIAKAIIFNDVLMYIAGNLTHPSLGTIASRTCSRCQNKSGIMRLRTWRLDLNQRNSASAHAHSRFSIPSLCDQFPYHEIYFLFFIADHDKQPSYTWSSRIKRRHRQALVVLANKMHAHERCTEAHKEANLVLGSIENWTELRMSQDALELARNRLNAPPLDVHITGTRHSSRPLISADPPP